MCQNRMYFTLMTKCATKLSVCYYNFKLPLHTKCISAEVMPPAFLTLYCPSYLWMSWNYMMAASVLFHNNYLLDTGRLSWCLPCLMRLLAASSRTGSGSLLSLRIPRSCFSLTTTLWQSDTLRPGGKDIKHMKVNSH